MAYLNGKEVVLVGLRGEKGDPGVGALQLEEDALLNQSIVPYFKEKPYLPTTVEELTSLFGLSEEPPADGLTRSAFVFMGNGQLKTYRLSIDGENAVWWDPDDDGKAIDKGDTVTLVPTSTDDKPRLYLALISKNTATSKSFEDVFETVGGSALFVDEEGYISIDY